MISVILQIDHVFYLNAASPIGVTSLSSCCNLAGPSGIKRGGCGASAEAALRGYRHSLPFVLILSCCYCVLGNELESEG